jgi:hypothetical protein
MVLGSRGEMLFYGDLEEAISYEQQNVTIDSKSESEEKQFDTTSHLTNSNTNSDY